MNPYTLRKEELHKIGNVSEGKIYKGDGDWLDIDSPEGSKLLELTKLVDEVNDDDTAPAYKEVNGTCRGNYIAYNDVWYSLKAKVGDAIVDYCGRVRGLNWS